MKLLEDKKLLTLAGGKGVNLPRFDREAQYFRLVVVELAHEFHFGSFMMRC